MVKCIICSTIMRLLYLGTEFQLRTPLRHHPLDGIDISLYPTLWPIMGVLAIYALSMLNRLIIWGHMRIGGLIFHKLDAITQ